MEKSQENIFTFEKYDCENIDITGFVEGYTTEELTIPRKYGDYEIASISNKAFYNKGIRRLSIEKGNLIIHEGAFSNNNIEDLRLGDMIGDYPIISKGVFKNNPVKYLQVNEISKRMYKKQSKLRQGLEYIEFKNTEALGIFDVMHLPRATKGIYVEGGCIVDRYTAREIAKRNLTLYVKKGECVLPKGELSEEHYFEVDSHEHYRKMIRFADSF